MLLLFAFRNLLRNPRRSLLLLLTLGCGVGALFSFEGFNLGILDDYRVKTVHGQTGSGQIFRKGYREQAFEKPVEGWIENSTAVQESLGRLPGVVGVYPRLRFAAFLTRGFANVSGLGEGVDGAAEFRFFNALKYIEGGPLLSQTDGLSLGQGLARAIDAHVGDRVLVLGATSDGRLNGLDLLVTGIFGTGVASVDDVLFRVQLKQAQTLLETPKVESLVVGLSDEGRWQTLSEAVKKSFPDLAAYSFEEMDVVYYGHSISFLKSQFGLILVIILLVMVLGVLNLVSMGILERQKEIAMLRANGESRRGLFALLSVEGLIVGIVGSLGGIAGAFLLNATLLRHGIYMPPAPGFSVYYYAFLKLQLQNAWMGLLLGVAASVVGTWLGAQRVLRRPLAEALRAVGRA